MRLGFSLAVHTDPDILLIDEVLAVGDAAFIHRCHDTISDFKRRGKTLIFVAHDLDAVSRWCDHVLWLDKGVIKKEGSARYVIDSYLTGIEKSEQENLDKENSQDVQTAEQSENRWGNKHVEIIHVAMKDKQGQDSWLFHQHDDLSVEIEFKINKAVKNLVFGIGIIRVDGLQIHGTNTGIDDYEIKETLVVGQTGKISYKLASLSLTEGSYYLDVAAHAEDGTPYDYLHEMFTFNIRSKIKTSGIYNPVHKWEISLKEAQS